MKRLTFEREFFRLAGTMLGAQHDVVEYPHALEPFRFHLLGMSDYAYEMKLLCKEVIQ
jgi:hypothetical protein